MANREDLEAQRKQKLLEYFRQMLNLKVQEVRDPQAIEHAYEARSSKLLQAKMDDEHRQEELRELQQAREILLKQLAVENSQTKKQVNRNINLQTLQQDAAMVEQTTVQDDMGRSITLDVNISAKNQSDQLGAQNGLYLLPKLTMQVGGKQLADEKTQTISLEAAHKLADQKNIPIQPNFDKAGQLQFFSTSFKFDEQQKQSLLKQFLNLAMQTLKLSLNQQPQQQKSTAPTPFATEPVRK